MRREINNPFFPRHKFQDDIWGQIFLNDIERDLVETPEFQRLFRTSQLGFVSLVYRSANHTRGVHSIGACHVSEFLINHLNNNTERYKSKSLSDKYAPIEISASERVIIRLGALLHDISHVPLSHDIERKTHKIFCEEKINEPKENPIVSNSYYGNYPKHDDYESNPVLFKLLFDRENSILARVLKKYSKEFYNLIMQDQNNDKYKHIEKFIQSLLKLKILFNDKETNWDPEINILPELLFHLFLFEKPKDFECYEKNIAVDCSRVGELEYGKWGLGPENYRQEINEYWYQPFRHDIIGNTLSADLIDYLCRDIERLGTGGKLDLHLLNYFVLIRDDKKKLSTNERYVCSIDIHDYKRGTNRVKLLNSIFRLLELRYEIHEKAVRHRVVQSANAMLSRALLLLGEKAPSILDIINIGISSHALNGEDIFFKTILNICDNDKCFNDERLNIYNSKKLIQKLIDRRIFRPLMIIPGDRAHQKFKFNGFPEKSDEKMEYDLRTLSTIINSQYYSSFLLYVTMCVEKLLQGLIESYKDIEEINKRFYDKIDKTRMINEQFKFIPSRIILWTTPYKQLYKDPAVVVSLKNWSGAIEEIKNLKDRDTIEYEAISELTKTSIKYFDNKYASLWKLYIFISDGLYYIGLFNKLKASKNNGNNYDSILVEHKKTLQISQELIIAALDTIKEDWNTNYIDTTSEQKTNILKSDINGKPFISLIGLWKYYYNSIFDTELEKKSIQDLSTVDIAHYAHRDPMLGDDCEICRDIRYKYDRNSAKKWSSEEVSYNESTIDLLNILQEVGIGDGLRISELEFNELLYNLNDNLKEKFNEIRKKRRLNFDDLKLFMLNELPKNIRNIFPIKEVSEMETRQIEIPDPKVIVDLKNYKEIKKWIDREVTVLKPNVRKEFNECTGEVVDFILRKDDINPKEILEDLQERFSNESRIVNNNIKKDVIMYILNRKFNTKTKAKNK